MTHDPHRRRILQASAGLVTGLAASALLPAAHAASAGKLASTIAEARSGHIRGQRTDGLHVFRGIPYGANTALTRFQAPRIEAPWRGVRDATAFGANAPQSGHDGPGSEDCLFLNVTTPALGDGKRRPILFYIHGGGFNNGSGSDPLYDGTQLCTHGDVVLVSVNHRLNAFGYLYLGEFDERFTDSGNAGQLDLVQALQWVREHAAEFGGDAGNVTVFGQSGGGAKIATLMAMPAAAGLFHRAWTMSGQQVTAAGPRAAAQRARLYMDALGAADVDGLMRLPAAALVAALRTRDPSRVEDMHMYLGPVMDGDALPRHPFWPDAPAQSAAIPMVIGNTHDETRSFLGNDPANFSLGWDDLPGKLRVQQFVDIDPREVVAEYRRLYPHYTPSEVFFAATTAGRSWRGAIEELEARARGGNNTWAYQLDWYPRDVDGGDKRRAFHTLDIPLVFDNIARLGSRTGTSPAAQRVADAMRDALLAFARSGDPRTRATSAWSPYSLQRRETMVFGATPLVQDDPRGGERGLYQRVPFVQRGTF